MKRLALVLSLSMVLIAGFGRVAFCDGDTQTIGTDHQTGGEAPGDAQTVQDIINKARSLGQH